MGSAQGSKVIHFLPLLKREAGLVLGIWLSQGRAGSLFCSKDFFRIFKPFCNYKIHSCIFICMNKYKLETVVALFLW